MLHMIRKGLFSGSGLCRLTAGALAWVLAGQTSFAAPALGRWGSLVDLRSDMPRDNEYALAVNISLGKMLASFAEIQLDAPPCDAAAEYGHCYKGVAGGGGTELPHMTTGVRERLANAAPGEIQRMFGYEELVSNAFLNGRYYVVRQYSGLVRQQHSPLSSGSCIHEVVASLARGTFDNISTDQQCDARQGLARDDADGVVSSVYREHMRNIRESTMRLPGVAGSFTIFVRPSEQVPGTLDLDYCTQQLNVGEE